MSPGVSFDYRVVLFGRNSAKKNKYFSVLSRWFISSVLIITGFSLYDLSSNWILSFIQYATRIALDTDVKFE